MMWSGLYQSFLWFPIPSFFFPKFLGTLPSVQITINIIVSLMFNSIFLILWQNRSICSSFFYFQYFVRQNDKDHLMTISFSFLLINTKSGFLVGIRLSVCILKSRRYYYFNPLRLFHTSFSLWSFTGVGLMGSLLKSPGLFSVLCPILIIL